MTPTKPAAAFSINALTPLHPYQRFEAVIADPNVMEVVCQRVIAGESLTVIAQSWDIAPGRFKRWIAADDERMAEYELAERMLADQLAHEALSIADGDMPLESVDEDGNPVAQHDNARDKLRIDTRLKLAAQWDRDKYGARIDTKITGQIDFAAMIEAGRARVRTITPEADITDVEPV
jgi:hypothetical protein